MRILVVVHAFPPGSKGGVETYVDAHARALAAQGHVVSVIAREADPSRPEYAVRTEKRRTDWGQTSLSREPDWGQTSFSRETDWGQTSFSRGLTPICESLTVTWINNTFRETTTFAESYANPAIDTIAARLIEAFRPDVAHVHHLTCLSTGILRELHARRVPIVFTLHDYWLMCHRGQLLDTNLRLCAGPGTDGCHACLGPSAAVAAPAAATRAFRAVERRLPETPRKWLRSAAESAAKAAATARGDARALDAERARLDHMRALLPLVDRFLAPSESLRRRFIAFGIPEARIVFSEYGFDARPFADLRREPRPDPLRTGFLGSAMISKGPHVLLEAFRGLPAGAATVDLFGEITAYHGDDSYRARLAPLLAQTGVTMHGAIPHERVPEALARLDVLVVPSIWPENSPLVIREAFLAGVPVVGSRIGGIPEAVSDGVNGLLFEPGRADDLARAVRRLIDEPGLLENLARGAAASLVRTIEDDAAQSVELYMQEPPAFRLAVAAPAHLAAIVLHYRHPDETRLSVKALLASRRPIDDVIVVDNDPERRCADALADVRDRIVCLANDRNLGFSGGMNVGIREALRRGATRVMLVNSDVIVPPDGVAGLERALDADPRLGAVGPVVLARTDPGAIATVGMSYHSATGRMLHSRKKDFGSPFSPVVVDGISGCAMLMTRAAIESVGLLDEGYFFSFEDLDWCLRARAEGFTTAIAPGVMVHHEGGRAMGADSPARLYYAARNHLRLARQAAPDENGPAAMFRTGSIVTLNLAHAVRAPGGTLAARVAAVLRGTRDHLRGRYGPDPGP